MNPFFILCVTVCLAIFLMTALIATLLIGLTARLLRYGTLREWLVRRPALLFSLRVSPLVFGFASTLGFALPSFLLLEPRQTAEKPEAVLLVLSGLAFAVLSILIARCARVLWTTRRIVQTLQRTSERLTIPGMSLPVFGVEGPKSLIAVIGFIRAQLFIGKDVLTSLSEDELRAAIAHEVAHVRSFDNLKQLILRVTRLPRCFRQLAFLDATWSFGAEFAADENALRSGTCALDLGSALIKVGRLSDSSLRKLSVAASHLIPPGCSSAVGLRVEHLQDLLRGTTPSPRPSFGAKMPGLLLALALGVYAVILPSSLPLAHRVIEWLVR